MQIAHGVYALPIEVEFHGVLITIHPVLVELDSGAALIDTGLAHTIDQLEERITDTGHTMREIRLLVLTHQDGDHAGAGLQVKERSGAVACSSPFEAQYITGKKTSRGPESNRYDSYPVDIELPEGTVFRTAAGPMEVVDTPGHTGGHISLFLRDSGIVIAGDALAVHKGELSGPHPRMSDDMETARRSIARLADYPVRGALCFHGGYIDADPGRLRRIAGRGSY